jgi:5-(carboxyamino)imidazole ribonucleotide synthase
VIAPGGIIGMLGGGQLGRMTALAAASLGYRCHIYCPEPGSPAAQVTPLVTVAGYHDRAALERFAEAVDVVTLEFENVPAATVSILAATRPVHPGAAVLATCQDRLLEKDFVRALGIATTRYRRVTNQRDLVAAIAEIGAPAILKTSRWGYDGKGQAAIGADDDPAAAWDAIGNAEAILEARVDFEREISVVVARGADGAVAAYPAVENRHVHHILDTTIAPASIDVALAAEADRVARVIAEGLDLVGVLGVEMFLTKDRAILVNELAPRPHNSGHWTIDACVTSQFEQLVRAVCGLPLGSAEAHSRAVMKNLIGGEITGWRDALDDPFAKLHLYGKAETRPDRKMGHVTRLMPRRD